MIKKFYYAWLAGISEVVPPMFFIFGIVALCFAAFGVLMLMASHRFWLATASAIAFLFIVSLLNAFNHI